MTKPDALYHVSDRDDIVRFDPRPSPSAMLADAGPLIWAVDDAHLVNYMLPRDCPRVTFAAAEASDPADVDRLLGAAWRVVAVESAWFDRIRQAILHCYTMPPATFELADNHAGYYVSRRSVEPIAMATIDDLLAALIGRGVELRVMPSLWRLRDAVVASTLEYSMIRMRNAQPRTDVEAPSTVHA